MMRKTLILVLLVLTCVLQFACDGAAPAAQSGAAVPVEADAPAAATPPMETPVPTPTPTPAPKEQHGEPDTVIFDQDGYRLTVKSYAFVENEKLELELAIEAVDKRCGSFGIEIVSINGWVMDIRMETVDNKAVSQLNQTIVFDLSESRTIPMMQIRQLQEVKLSVYGWDSSSLWQFGEGPEEHALDLSTDAEPGYVQTNLNVSDYFEKNDVCCFASLGYNEGSQEIFLFYETNKTERFEDRLFASVVNGIQGPSDRLCFPSEGGRGILCLDFSEQMALMDGRPIEKLDVNIDGEIYSILGASVDPQTNLNTLPLLYEDESVRVRFVRWGTDLAGNRMPYPVFLVENLTQHYSYRVNGAALETKEAGKPYTYEASGNTRWSDNLPQVAPKYAMLCDMGEYYNNTKPNSYDYWDRAYPNPVATDAIKLSFDLIRSLNATYSELGYVDYEGYAVPEKWLTEEEFQKDKAVQAILEQYRTTRDSFTIWAPGDKTDVAFRKGLGQRRLNDGTMVSDLMYERVGDQEGYLVKSNGIVVSDTVKIHCSLDEEIEELLPKVCTASSLEPFYKSDYATIYYLGSEPCVATPSDSNAKPASLAATRLLFDVQMEKGAAPVWIGFYCTPTLTGRGAGRAQEHNKSGKVGIETTTIATGYDKNYVQQTSFIDVSEGVDTLYLQIEIFNGGLDADGNRERETLCQSEWAVVKLR